MALTVTTNIHTDAATTFVVKSSPGSKVSWLSIDSPDMTSHAEVFMNDAALRRLRDAIDAHLGEAKPASADVTAIGDEALSEAEVERRIKAHHDAAYSVPVEEF